MARATCRCGQDLELPPPGVEHVTCPRCAAKVRLVRKGRAGNSASSLTPGDDFIRFHCPCGRRLKVSAVDRPSHGKCPDCGRVVPVPEGEGSPGSGAESPTVELGAADLAMLEAWAKTHAARGNGKARNGAYPPEAGSERPMSTAEMAMGSPKRHAEAGFRVCPRCGKPMHLNAETCRGCGTAVPKR